MPTPTLPRSPRKNERLSWIPKKVRAALTTPAPKAPTAADLRAAAAALLAAPPEGTDSHDLAERAGRLLVAADAAEGRAPTFNAVDREADRIVSHLRAAEGRSFDTSSLSDDEQRVALAAITTSGPQLTLARRGTWTANECYEIATQLRAYTATTTQPRPSLDDLRIALALIDRLEG